MADVLEAVRRRWRNAYGRVRDSEAPLTLLLAAVLLGLVMGLWMGRLWIPEDTGAASENDRARLSEGQDRRPSAHAAHASGPGSTSVRLDRCQEVYSAQVRPLREVGPAMTQWEVHIGAMNKLVVGAITLDQAQAFWNETREGAAKNLAEFGHTYRLFEQRTARCPVPVGRASRELRGCVAVVGSRDRELGRAGVALDTWRTHVRHMEMLRRGEMSPAEATQMWLESWREGTREVDAYRSAARVTHHSSGGHHHPGGAGGPCTAG